MKATEEGSKMPTPELPRRPSEWQSARKGSRGSLRSTRIELRQSRDPERLQQRPNIAKTTEQLTNSSPLVVTRKKADSETEASYSPQVRKRGFCLHIPDLHSASSFEAPSVLSRSGDSAFNSHLINKHDPFFFEYLPPRLRKEQPTTTTNGLRQRLLSRAEELGTALPPFMSDNTASSCSSSSSSSSSSSCSCSSSSSSCSSSSSSSSSSPNTRKNTMSLQTLTNNKEKEIELQHKERKLTPSESSTNLKAMDAQRRESQNNNVQRRDIELEEKKEGEIWSLRKGTGGGGALPVSGEGVEEGRYLKGATLPKLVERLTRHESADLEFNATFLLTYQTFCSSSTLVRLLKQRFEEAEKNDGDVSKTRAIRLRICHVLHMWVEEYFEDFGEDEDLLLELVNSFLGGHIGDPQQQTNLKDISINNSLASLQSLVRRKVDQYSHKHSSQQQPTKSSTLLASGSFSLNYGHNNNNNHDFNSLIFGVSLAGASEASGGGDSTSTTAITRPFSPRLVGKFKHIRTHASESLYKGGRRNATRLQKSFSLTSMPVTWNMRGKKQRMSSIKDTTNSNNSNQSTTNIDEEEALNMVTLKPELTYYNESWPQPMLSKEIKVISKAWDKQRNNTNGGLYGGGPEEEDVVNLGEGGWMGLHPLELARQLSLLESKIFRAIQPRELLGQGWSKKETADQLAPNVKAMIQNSNRITSWVQTEIVKCADETQRRVSIIRRFIRIAEWCEKLHNLNAVLEITAGLSSAAIHRLKETWKLVPKKDMRIYERLRASFVSDNNYKAYRELLQSFECPLVPYLGFLYLVSSMLFSFLYLAFSFRLLSWPSIITKQGCF
ncbi:cell division cycle-related protein [Balamuthia mandrillaris]